MLPKEEPLRTTPHFYQFAAINGMEVISNDQEIMKAVCVIKRCQWSTTIWHALGVHASAMV